MSSTSGNTPPNAAQMAQRAQVSCPGSIFSNYRDVGSTVLRDGSLIPLPYHNYDGNALIIWGLADADWVRGRLQGQPWQPVLSPDGRAHVQVWAVQYHNCNAGGPYREVIVLFSTCPAAAKVAPVDSPMKLLPLYDDKVANPYCYKIWLDRQLPLDYGREILGTDKYLDKAMKIDWTGDRNVDLECNHVAGELHETGPPGPLIRGSLRLQDGMHLGSVIGAYGLGRALGMAAGSRSSWQVVTPPGIIDRPNSRALGNPVFDFHYETSPKFTSARDAGGKLEYSGELGQCGFSASLYQHDPHVRTVILSPFSFTP